MQQPDILINPLGYGATANDPPETTPVGTNKLSIRDLFPPITSIPIEAGGIPPDRADMNGIVKLIGSRMQFFQNGGVYEYSEDLNYSPNNCIFYNNKLYKCLLANGAQTPAGIKAPTDTTYWLSYEDSITAAETNAKAYTDAQSVITLGLAKGYADSQDLVTLGNAKTYAETYTNSKIAEVALSVGDIKIVSYDVDTLDGWLLCDGSWLDQEVYPDLFDKIGLLWTDQTDAEYTGENFQIPDFSDRFLEGAGTITTGTYTGAGLPNITGTFGTGRGSALLYSASTSGAFYNNETRLRYDGGSGATAYDRTATIRFQASRSSAIYKSITTVQPASASIKYFIKY